MEIAKLILEFIKTLVYPTVLLVIFFALRNEIKSLLTGELSAKYKDLSITIKKKENVIKAMEENIRDAASALKQEIKTVQESEKWSGFDHEANRLFSALAKIDLSSDQHYLISFIKKKHGHTSVVELVNEIIKPGPGMDAYVFQREKQRLDLALEGMQEKGLVSRSNKGKVELHPWILNSNIER